MFETTTSETATSNSTIWCDFGGVVSPALKEATNAVANAMGVTWEALASAANEVAEDLGYRDLQPLELGLISQNNWADRVTEKLGGSARLNTSLRDFDKHYYRDRRIDAQLLAELQRFRAQGIPVGMLTNSVLEWEPHRTALLRPFEAFDHYLRSHEGRLAKPDPAIYSLADTLLGHPDSQRILIDDLAPNCAAAVGHGWLAIQHVDTTETVAQLRRLTSISR